MNCPNITPYYTKKIKTNLLDRFAQLDEQTYTNGLYWYPDAYDFNDFIARKYGVDIEDAVKCTAVLSPASVWERNKLESEVMIRSHVTDTNYQDHSFVTYSNNVKKAKDILTGSVDLEPTSPKTYRFYRNMLLDENYVTIDRWHLRACFNKNIKSITPKRYEIIEQITLDVADSVGLKGYEFQAMIWEQIRGE